MPIPLPFPCSDPKLVEEARKHLTDVLGQAIEHDPQTRALVVWDSDSELARTLTQAYASCLPEAEFLEFGTQEPASILEAFGALQPKDLVVLVQSTSFRLNAFRIRIELFRRGLKVIEHPHLERMTGDEAGLYVAALAYDKDYYRSVGHGLKRCIDRAGRATLVSAGLHLDFRAGLEPAKLNIGDYATLNNVGGQFPIGEVFTESRDLEAVSGSVRIACFGDTNYRVNRPRTPITLVVQEGRVCNVLDGTPEFERVLEQIRAHEGEVWVRELGFGMNRALSHASMVCDIGTFERMCGVHLSLGAKHASYKKPNINKRSARYHVDVFAITEEVRLDDINLFREGAWCLPAIQATATGKRSAEG